jgi:hypothetical protein
MKTRILLLIMVLLAVNAFAQNTKKVKMIPHKSAIVEYVFEGNTTGRQTLYYDDYGWYQCQLDQTVQKVMGQKTANNNVTVTKGFDVWSWDPKTRIGTFMHNDVAEAILNDPDFDAEEFAKELLEATGFKKIGTEMYDGKLCEVWEGLATKAWVWNGFSLKVEAKMFGIKIVQKAVSVKIDADIPKNRFDVPSDVKFQEVEGDPFKAMNKAMEEERKAAGESGETENTNDGVPEELPIKSIDDLKGFLKKLPRQ